MFFRNYYITTLPYVNLTWVVSACMCIAICMPAADDFITYATVAINAYKSCIYSHQRRHHVTWASVIV